MGFQRNEGGEHATFLIRLLLLLIQKTPEGGATLEDIRELYAEEKGSMPSDKSIQRAIRTLNMIFDPSSTDEDSQYRTPRNQLPVRAQSVMQNGEKIRHFTFHRMLTSEKEANSDKAAQVLFHFYPQQRHMQTEDFEQVFALLTASLGQQGKNGEKLRHSIESFIFVSGFTPAESRENLRKMLQLFQAFRRQKRVRFQYTSATSGEKTAGREVNPYGLISRNGTWYLVGHCHFANSVRIFRIDHIQRLAIVENSTYTVPGDYSLVKKYGPLWGIWTSPTATENIQLHVSACIASNFETVRYHSSQKVQKNDDGSLEVRFTLGGAREMVSWLMGFGPNVKVVEPTWLREEVVENAKRLLQQYEQA